MKQTPIITNALRGIVTAALCVAATQTTQAALIFSNLTGAGYGGGTTNGAYYATDFVTGPSSTTITGATFSAYNHTAFDPFAFGGYNVGVSYSVVADNGGEPGTLSLASFNIPSVTSASPSLQTFSFPASFSLDANTTYWLVTTVYSGTPSPGVSMMAGPGSGGTSSGVFSLLPGTADKYAPDNMSMMAGNWSDLPSSVTPAFEFTGNISPIPEPGTTATGVLLLGAALLKRRRYGPSKSPLPQVS